MTPASEISPVKISTVLEKVAFMTFAAAIVLLVINIFFAFHLDSLSHWVFRVFGTGEQNILTWLSSALLLYCALMLTSIGLSVKQRSDAPSIMSRRWIELSIIFFLLSLDEVAELHEGVNVVLTRSYDLKGYFYFAWIIPGAVFALTIFVRTLGLLRTLPATIRRRMLFSGALYLAGAIGIEAVGANYSFHAGQVQDLTFQLLCTVEEGLEVLGLWVFYRTLVLYFDSPATGRSPKEDTIQTKVSWPRFFAELGPPLVLGLVLVAVTDFISPYLGKLDSSRIPGLIEAEQLPRTESLNVHAERVRLQPGAAAGKISRNSLLQLVPLGPGAQQSFILKPPRPGKYRLDIYMARHPSFGEVSVRLNEKFLQTINLSSPSEKVLPTGPIDLGVRDLGETNTLTFMLLNPRMQYVFDGIRMTPVITNER